MGVGLKVKSLPGISRGVDCGEGGGDYELHNSKLKEKNVYANCLHLALFCQRVCSYLECP